MRCPWCLQPVRQAWSLRQLVLGPPVVAGGLCARCLGRLTRIEQSQACPGCGRAESPHLCQDCRRWQQAGLPLLHNQAWFRYTTEMKALIQQYKGLGDYQLHTAFAGVVQVGRRDCALVPIPSEPGHFARRGFDPVQALFGHLPLAAWLTKADTPTPQAQKDRQARLLTPQSFTAHLPARVPAHVILLDDLYTTGRTLYHAQAALRAAGYAGSITSRTLIR